MAKKRKRIKKKVTKKKTSKKKVTKKKVKKSTKKKRRVAKRAMAPKKVATITAPETMDQPHQHDSGHSEPIDNLISEITDNEPEHGSAEQSTEEADDFGARNDTENLG